MKYKLNLIFIYVNYNFFGLPLPPVHRSSQLRRLKLSSCNGMTSEGLSEMFKKLPLLEELHLKYMPISKQAIEVAGRCCPLLKSFKLNNHGYRCPYIRRDEDALAISENLHGLRHLQLFNNKMTIEGLIAITANCSHLESLDIRQCFNVPELGSDLRKRLSEQIKDLRLPYDSTVDRGFDTEMHNCEACRSYSGPSGTFDSDVFPDELYDYSDIDSDYYELFADEM